MSSDWERSARGWIEAQGEAGDWTRLHVLDGPMLVRVAAGQFKNALDVGCGEGRFCRLLQAQGITATGIDPSESLIAQARARDPHGDYRIARAESLPFEVAQFDRVISYLSLIDIPDLPAAIREMVRVLAPGGSLLIANLSSFAIASVVPGGHWVLDESGNRTHFGIDRYLDERAEAVAWGGISVVNYHRPLSTYMRLLLGQGLRLVHFDEPRAEDDATGRAAVYDRVPYAFLMEWRKEGGE